MPLAHIANGHNDTGGYQLTRYRMEVQVFDKEHEEEIVDQEIDQKRDQVSEELDPAFKIGFYEYKVFVQQKSEDKIYAEGNE